ALPPADQSFVTTLVGWIKSVCSVTGAIYTNRGIWQDLQTSWVDGFATTLTFIPQAIIDAIQGTGYLHQFGPGFLFQRVHHFIILCLCGLLLSIFIKGSGFTPLMSLVTGQSGL